MMRRKSGIPALNLLLTVVLAALFLAFPVSVSAVPNVTEEYWPGTSTPDFAGLGSQQWGQSWVAASNHPVSGVELRLYSTGGTADSISLTVSLYEADGEGKPSGSALATATLNCNYLSGSGYYSQVFYFSPADNIVTELSKYALVIVSQTAFIGPAITSPGGYADGDLLSSSDGVNWNVTDTIDIWFRIIEERPPQPDVLWTTQMDDTVTSVAAGDLNNDGTEDVAAIDKLPAATLLALRGEGDGLGAGSELWSAAISGYVVEVGDIDGDNLNEVVAGVEEESNNKIVAFENDGTPKWEYPTGGLVKDIAIGDIDNDGINDVVACNNYSAPGIVYALDGETGNDLTGWPFTDHPDENYLHLALGQLDGEGGLDVAVIGIGQYKTLFMIDSEGTEIWNWLIDGQAVEIGDVNGDGSNEVVAGTFSGYILALAGDDGELLFDYQLEEEPVTDIALGDLDDDITNGVEVACIYGEQPVLTPNTLYAVDLDAGVPVMWSYPMSWETGYYGECLAIGDVDRDYLNEIVACSSVGVHRVYAFDGIDSNGDGIGDLVWQPYEVTGTPDLKLTDLVIGDLDGDGDQDVAVGSNTFASGGAGVIALTNHEDPVEAVTGSGTVYFDSDPSSLEDIQAVSLYSLPSYGRPDYSYPHGFFSFDITALAPGQSCLITVTLPTAAPVGTKWVKYQDGEWLVLDIGDDDGDNVITFVLTDEDGDGVISDPGAPAYQRTTLAVVGGEVRATGRGLSLWLAALLLAGAGLTVYFHRRRRTG